MRVLVACEFSGRVRDALLRRGHDAWSCDLLPCESDPSRHLQQDVRPLLRKRWDMVIAHPECRRLCNSGVRWLHERNLWDEMREAAAFFVECLDANAERVAVENPIMHGYALEIIGRRADQFVHPHWFGTPETKATGWWLKGLSPLVPTNPVTGRKPRVHYESPGPERSKNRSRTDPNMAEAVADQWGGRAIMEAA